MNREFLYVTTFFAFPTFLMYYLSNLMINKTNNNNKLLNKIVLLEEKFLHLEEKIEDLEEFKTTYYQRNIIDHNWFNIQQEISEDEDEED